METYLETLQTERLHAATRIREIVNGAADAKRALSAEEQTTLDAADADYDRLKAEEQRIVELRDKLAEGDATRAQLAPATSRVAETSEREEEVLSVVRATYRAMKDDLKPAERVLDLEIDMQKVVEARRALADFSDGAALYINDFRTTVALYQRTASPLINVASVITADNGRPIVLPNMTADPTTVSPGEGTAITENSGTLGEATATPIAYKTLSYISSEAEEDELVGILQLIAKTQGRSLGIFAGTAMTASLVTAASNGGTAAGLGGGSTAAFVGYEDLLDLKYGRAVPYRMVGGWLMSNGVIKKARKWTDKNGQYLWQPAIAAGQPDLFDGQAVYEDPGLAAPASATKSVLYGDLSAWVIKQRPLRVAVSTEYRFNTDQVAIRTTYRAGGALPDTAAIAYLISASS